MGVQLLSRLDNGEKGRIVKIRGEAGMHRYLFELGLVVGRVIVVEKTNMALLADPIKVRVNGSVLSLEKDIATNIHIEVA
jgi:Fe2+ transport system protein FeoA